MRGEVPKKTTIIRFGWTCGNVWWTLGENTPDEIGSGDDETTEARISEVNHDHPMEKDVWHLISNSRRKHSG
jgi:hypothetical protein